MRLVLEGLGVALYVVAHAALTGVLLVTVIMLAAAKGGTQQLMSDSLSLGVGDFDGDARADILWRNATSGENYVYLMNGVAIANEGYLRTRPASSLRIDCGRTKRPCHGPIPDRHSS
jgi:hypothetical protein